MSLNFPPNPVVNQTYMGINNITYVFDGTKWNAQYSEGTIWKKDETTSTITPVIPDDKLSVQTYVIEDLRQA